MSATLLVTGASGHLGRRVVELLLEAHADSIIATTRNPEKLADLAERGVTVRYASFDEPDSLAEAFAGADRMLLISTDALDEPGKRRNQQVTAVKAADAAGVSHVVYTSMIHAENTPILIAPDHAATEQALAESSMGWSVLRNNTYTEVVLQSVSQAYQLGSLYSAAGDGKTAYVTREDCAKAAAAVLLGSFDGKRTLDITGSEALSQADIAAIASSVTGETLSYTPIPVEAAIQAMVDAGLPKPVAEVYASFDVATAQGKSNVVTSAFEELTGEKPTTVKEFLTAHQAALREAIVS